MTAPCFDQFIAGFQKKPHHAWLLKGSHPQNKIQFLHKLCQHLLPDLSLPPQKQGWSQTMHPAFLYISPEGANSISVDQIRKIHHRAVQTSGPDEWKICIIDSLNQLTLQGQNALLKVLESPPPKNLFLIIHQPGHALLPTIASRCASLTFGNDTTQSASEKVKNVLLSVLGENETWEGTHEHILQDIATHVSHLITHQDDTHAILALCKKHSLLPPLYLEILQVWTKTAIRFAALKETDTSSPLSILTLENLLEFDQYMNTLIDDYKQFGIDDKQAVFSACQKLKDIAAT